VPGMSGPGSIPGTECLRLITPLSIKSFRRAVEFGLSAKRETASGFECRTIGQPMDSHLAFCPSLFRAGPLCFDYRTGSSTETEQPVQTGRHGFDSRPEKAKPSLARPLLADFRRVAGLGYRLIRAWVAGSSPAPGSRCRGSSVVEHANSQFVSYPSVFYFQRRPRSFFSIRLLDSIDVDLLHLHHRLNNVFRLRRIFVVKIIE
jgi:hypothetical protein